MIFSAGFDLIILTAMFGRHRCDKYFFVQAEISPARSGGYCFAVLLTFLLDGSVFSFRERS